MKIQWNLIVGLIFSLFIAIFAVANVTSVHINYLFGYMKMPLILIILGSALLGGLIVGMFGIFHQYKMQWKIKKLEKQLKELKLKKDCFDKDKTNIEESSDKANSINLSDKKNIEDSSKQIKEKELSNNQ